MISLDISRLVEAELPDSIFLRAAQACGDTMGTSLPLGIGLTLTDDAGIRQINRDWRGLDQATDVLSFPSLPLSPGRLFRQDLPDLHQAWDSGSGTYFLGDIIINVAQARRQAAAYRHSLFREMTYLFVHGVFHLFGYDHMTKEDQTDMRKQEEQALQTAFLPTARDEELLTAAREARNRAYTPYSHYNVGAALLGKDGKIYTGCNVENASFGLTNCAERTAVFKAVSEGQREFEAIAIAAGQTAPWPCGACRQVLNEFAPKLKVLITWGKDQVDETTLDALLPHSFTGFEEDQHG